MTYRQTAANDGHKMDQLIKRLEQYLMADDRLASESDFGRGMDAGIEIGLKLALSIATEIVESEK